jgi:hypothetical protein
VTVQTAWRTPAVSLGRIESRHAGRSLILWLGVAVAVISTLDSLRGYLPVLPAFAAVAYHHGEIFAGFALLAGARLGLRDHQHKTAVLIGATPTGEGKIRAARLCALAPAAVAASVLLQAAGFIAAVVAHAPAAPVDWLLVPDGAAATVLASWLGYGLGCLGFAVVPLVAAPSYVALTFVLGHYETVKDLSQSVQWLLPNPPLPDWSADLGFVPNIFPLHLAYLAGLLALTGGALVAWPGRSRLRRARSAGVSGPGEAGITSRAAWAAAVAGLAVAYTLGAQLQARPDNYQVSGPNTGSWIPAYHDQYGLQSGVAGIFPDDHKATACAGGPSLRTCVYPAYGKSLAAQAYGLLAPEARAIEAVTGRPESVRMVPVFELDPCDGPAQFLLDETQFRWVGSEQGTLIQCALPQLVQPDGGLPTDHPVPEAVAIWLMLRAGELTRHAAQAALVNQNPAVSCVARLPCTPQYADVLFPGALSFSRADLRAGLAIAALPSAEVTARLGALWPRIVAGTLPLSALPGQPGAPA